MASVDEDFPEAASHWDLQKLYQDLASVKGKNLTPVEKQHLRGLLCGYSPSEIAQKLHKSIKGVEIAFSNTIYQYVKNLVNQSNSKIENWRNISEWLEAEGYKSSDEKKISDYSFLDILINQCDITVRQCNLTLRNNHILIDLNIHLSSPLSPDIASDESDEEVLGTNNDNDFN